MPNRFELDKWNVGRPAAVCSIDDCAIDRIVGAFSTIDPKWINRIDHCEFPIKEAADSIAEHGYAVMTQPGYSWIDRYFLHNSL